MGTRCDLELECAYCGKKNEEIWYAPTCDADSFECKYCGRMNFVCIGGNSFFTKKIKDTTADDLFIGWMSATSMAWTKKEKETIKNTLIKRLDEMILEDKRKSSIFIEDKGD